MNLGRAMIHLFDAFEKLGKVTERTRRLFWVAVARLKMKFAIQVAASWPA